MIRIESPKNGATNSRVSYGTPDKDSGIVHRSGAISQNGTAGTTKGYLRRKERTVQVEGNYRKGKRKSFALARFSPCGTITVTAFRYKYVVFRFVILTRRGLVLIIGRSNIFFPSGLKTFILNLFEYSLKDLLTCHPDVSIF